MEIEQDGPAKARFQELLNELAKCYEDDVAHARTFKASKAPKDRVSTKGRVSIQMEVAEVLERSRSLPGSIGSEGLASIHAGRCREPVLPQRGDFKSRKSTAKMSLASLQGGCLAEFQLHIHPQWLHKAPEYRVTQTRSSAVSPRNQAKTAEQPNRSLSALHPEARLFEIHQ